MRSILSALAVLIAAFAFTAESQGCVVRSRACRQATGSYYLGKVVKERKPLRATAKFAGRAVLAGVRLVLPPYCR